MLESLGAASQERAKNRAKTCRNERNAGLSE
jgi:hypothetical protein